MAETTQATTLTFLLREYASCIKLSSNGAWKYTEGGIGHASIPNGLGTTMCAECHMISGTIWACGMDCQQLGSCYYACSDHNSVHGHFASAQLLFHVAWERITLENTIATHVDSQLLGATILLGVTIATCLECNVDYYPFLGNNRYLFNAGR